MTQLDELLKVVLELEKRIEHLEKVAITDNRRILTIVDAVKEFGKIEGLM